MIDKVESRMTEQEVLKEKLYKVALIRQKYLEAVDAKKRALEEWEQQNADLITIVTNLTQEKEEAEANLREETLRAYEQTGNKKPMEGVGIREVTLLKYDEKVALAWAMEHKISLSLDKKAFEGLVKTAPLDFVEVLTEARATIATDLSSILKEEALSTPEKSENLEVRWR